MATEPTHRVGTLVQPVRRDFSRVSYAEAPGAGARDCPDPAGVRPMGAALGGNYANPTM